MRQTDIPPTSPTNPPGSSVPSNSLQLISETLKRADHFIRKGELPRAQEELARAKTIAPHKDRKSVV
jgi:hypothetical protein